MSDVVEKVAHAWASMDGKPYGEGYVEDAAFLLRQSGVGRRIEELEAKLAKVTAERDEELNQLGSAMYTIDALKTYIKELKGQDDE